MLKKIGFTLQMNNYCLLIVKTNKYSIDGITKNVKLGLKIIHGFDVLLCFTQVVILKI